MHRALRLLAGLLLLAGAGPVCAAACIFIVSDMEGGGVSNADAQLLPGRRGYDESRRPLAGELNAAVEGALAAGATEVVIWDGHDGSRSLSVDDSTSPPIRHGSSAGRSR